MRFGPIKRCESDHRRLSHGNLAPAGQGIMFTVPWTAARPQTPRGQHNRFYKIHTQHTTTIEQPPAL